MTGHPITLYVTPSGEAHTVRRKLPAGSAQFVVVVPEWMWLGKFRADHGRVDAWQDIITYGRVVGLGRVLSEGERA